MSTSCRSQSADGGRKRPADGRHARARSRRRAAGALALTALLTACPGDEVSLGDDRMAERDGGSPDASKGAAGSQAGGSGGQGGSAGAGGSAGTGRGFVPPANPSGAACGTRNLPPCMSGQFCAYSEADDCGESDPVGHCEWRPRSCTTELDPVCGCDGITYPNACIAAAVATSIKRAGACNPNAGSGLPCGGGFGCPEGEYCRYGGDGQCGGPRTPGVCSPAPTDCSRDSRPVCGCDDLSYENRCEAAAAGLSVRHGGYCEDGSGGSGGGGGSEPADAGMSGLPCGGFDQLPCDSDEYCDVAAGDGCVPDARGECRPRPAMCQESFAPVCGCDGTSFANACEAAAAGMSIDHDGPCQ